MDRKKQDDSMNEGLLQKMPDQRGKAIQPADTANSVIAMITKPAIMREIVRAMPRAGCTPDHFLRCVMTSIRKNTDLARCKWESLLGAMIELAQLGLEPGTPLGHAWLAPFGAEAQILLGYKGLIHLANRGSKISMTAEAVYEGDQFEYELGTKPYLKHRKCDELSKRGAITHAYSIAIYPDGRPPSFKVVNRADLDAARAHSQSYQKEMAKARANKNYVPHCIWIDHEAAMSMKTAIRRHAAFLSLSSEFARAIELDRQGEEEGRQIFDLSGVDVSVLPSPTPAMRADAIERELEQAKENIANGRAAEVVEESNE